MRWGQFDRCNSSCNTFRFGTMPVTCRAAAPMHGGGASILAIDLDGDTDKDIIVGADMCPDLVRLTNNGTAALARLDSVGFSLNYPLNTTPASIINFPAAYFEDVNFDGKKDLLVAPFLADNLDKANFTSSAWLYLNNASTATAPPVFAFNKNNFLQDQMIDVGLEAFPAFADIDADGDLDMLVGNYADYRFGATAYRSSVSLYTNVGTAANPVFKLTNNDYLQLGQADYRKIALQFADLNGDGSQDLILKYLLAPENDGYVDYIPNTAAPGQPFSFSRSNQIQLGLDINADDYPFFYDIDGDGNLDVLVGTSADFGTNKSSGAIHFYRQVGTNLASFSSWQFVSHSFGQIPRTPGKLGLRPILADLNLNNKPELITADDSGVLNIYPDITNNLTSAFTGLNTILASPLSGPNQTTSLGLNIHLAAADLDNDQKPELIVGTNGGGLTHFKNNSRFLGIPKAAADLNVTVFPNPAQNKVMVTGKEEMQVTVFDLAGRQLGVSSARYKINHELDISALKPGIYYLQITMADFRVAGRKLIIQR